MGRVVNYIPVDSIFTKLYRDFRIEKIDESEIIEWIGEALEFINTPSALENAVAVIPIKNHQAKLPNGLKSIIQVVRDNEYKYITPLSLHKDFEEEIKIETFHCPECGDLTLDEEILTLPKYYDIYADVNKMLEKRVYKTRFTPIRLSNHSFFNSLVCKAEDSEIYKSCIDEYTIVNGNIRTSFKEGSILLSYYRNMTDKDTGYPLIPDDISALTAIEYYIAWKYTQRVWLTGREGFHQQMGYFEERWLKYVKQAKANQVMPSGEDEFQNLSSVQGKINDYKSYFGYFGNLNRM